MREYTKYIILIFFILLKNYSCSYIFAQTKIDSLENLLKTSKQNTNKVKILNALSWELRNTEFEKALIYAKEALLLSKKLNDKLEMSVSMNNMGNSYTSIGDYTNGLNYYLKALIIREEIGNKRGIARSLNNIGTIYFFLKNAEKSIEYFLRSLKMLEELNDREGLPASFNNVGGVYRIQKKYDKALKYFMKALSIVEEIDEKKAKGAALNNIAAIHFDQRHFEKAKEYLLKSLKVKQETGDKKGMALSLNSLGSVYRELGNIKKAFIYHKKSLSIAKEIRSKPLLKSCYESLAGRYSDGNNYKKAYQYHQLYAQVKDSLFNEEKAKEIGKLEARNEFEKKITEEKARTEAEAKAEAERQKTSNFLQYSVIVIFIAVLLLVVFTLGRLFPSKKEGRPASHRRLGGMLPVRVSKFLIFIIFLLLFEFILVLSDSFVEKLSEGAPLIKVLFNVIVATIFFPVHRFFEAKISSWLFQTPDNLEAGTKKPIKNAVHFLIFFCSFCIINSPLPTQYSIAQSDGINPKTVNHQSKIENFRIDSLENLLKTAQDDTNKVRILNKLTWQYQKNASYKALEYGKQGLALAEKLDYTRGIAMILSNIGYVYGTQGNYKKAMEYYSRSLKVKEELKDKEGIASSLNHIGEIHEYRGDYDKALRYYLRSLRITEDLLEQAKQRENSDKIEKNNQGIINSFTNIGILYFYQGNYEKVVDYFLRSLKINKEIGSNRGIAHCMNNIGLVYNEEKKYDKALDYYKQSLKISEELGDKQGIANTLNNIGIIYYNQGGNFEKVRDYLQRSLKIKRELGNKPGIVSGLNNLGELFAKHGYYDKAIVYSKKSLAMAKEMNAKDDIKNAYLNLAKTLAKMGEHSPAIIDMEKHYKNAYEFHKLYTEMKDTLFNEEKSKEIGKVEENYALEKKLAAQKSHQEELARIEAEKKVRRDIMQYSGIFIFIVIFFVSLLTLGGILNLIPLWLINGLVFSAFLLFFEFMLVFLDPYIEALTGGAPALKLAINTVLASMIYPLHQFFEAKLKKRILKT